jgi:hypothetical protein
VILALPSKQAFTERGAESGVVAGSVQLACGSSGGRVCRAGDTLMFMVNSAATSGYFGAYAEPADRRGLSGERIWYFPTASGATQPRVERGSGTVVLPRGIKVGAEHHAGRYRVTVWLSTRPLRRSEVDTAGPETILGRSTIDFSVTE